MNCKEDKGTAKQRPATPKRRSARIRLRPDLCRRRLRVLGQRGSEAERDRRPLLN